MAYQSRSTTSTQEDWDARNKMSRTTSATYSVSSSSSRQTNVSVQESSAKIYYTKLAKYLASMLAKEATEGVPAQRTAARQKLSRLNNLQFHELATDVYDELSRRTADNHRSFLPIRDDFHPRRNQARQKLATLQTTRFKDLASDVYHELQRRYPSISVPDDHQPQLPPLPRSTKETQGLPSQSTNIIPVKGMMSVESIVLSDDEGDGQVPMTDSNNNQSLDSLMADLGNMVRTPQPPEHRMYPESQQDTQNEYERKIESMAKRIRMLELALENDSSGPHSDKDRQMRMKQMQDEYKDLDYKYNQLSKEHTEQQKAVKEVKSEIKQLIEELKALSTRNESLRLQNEKCEAEIRNLTQENKSWKRKYETISMELRSFKVNSIMLDKQDMSQDFFMKPNPKGAIGQQFVIEYQTAINDLMKTSRSSKPSDVLFSMRNIVMACKSITSEVEEYEVKVGLSLENQEALYEIKKRFTDELTTLLAATKSYAGGLGISPVSLVDAAAGNLTTTIVDLVKLLGMRPIQEGVRTVPNANNKMTQMQNGNTTLTPAQLSNFLKEETDHIVDTVQELLAALRSNDTNLANIVTSIINILSNIVQTSQNTFASPEGAKYKNKGNLILGDLEKSINKIMQIRDTAFTKSSEGPNAIAKRNLAQESYEIAKYTKELISMLDM